MNTLKSTSISRRDEAHALISLLYLAIVDGAIPRNTCAICGDKAVTARCPRCIERELGRVIADNVLAYDCAESMKRIKFITYQVLRTAAEMDEVDKLAAEAEGAEAEEEAEADDLPPVGDLDSEDDWVSRYSKEVDSHAVHSEAHIQTLLSPALSDFLDQIRAKMMAKSGPRTSNADALSPARHINATIHWPLPIDGAWSTSIGTR